LVSTAHSAQPEQPQTVKRLRHVVIITCSFLLLATQLEAADRRIYRCEIGDQPVLYSQFVCPPDRTAHLVRPGDHSIIAIPSLSPEESAALQSLERSLSVNRAEQRNKQRRAQRSYRRELQQAASLCDAARAGLEEIRIRKRQGYNAAQARRLEREQEQLQALKKANC